MIYLYLFGTCFHFIYVFMIIENVFNKFDHLQSKWEEFIDVSFIQETTKERYKELIHENWKRIK